MVKQEPGAGSPKTVTFVYHNQLADDVSSDYFTPQSDLPSFNSNAASPPGRPDTVIYHLTNTATIPDFPNTAIEVGIGELLSYGNIVPVFLC